MVWRMLHRGIVYEHPCAILSRYFHNLVISICGGMGVGVSEITVSSLENITPGGDGESGGDLDNAQQRINID